jgi:hypothetical protein
VEGPALTLRLSGAGQPIDPGVEVSPTLVMPGRHVITAGRFTGSAPTKGIEWPREIPDTATAVALAAAIGSSDAISAYETVVLIDPADIDAAASITVGYRAPG